MTAAIDPPYGVIPDTAISAAAEVIAANDDSGRLTAHQPAEAALHAAHPHMQPLMRVVDPDAFDAYAVTSSCDVWLTCPREDCAAEVHSDQFRPVDQPLTLGDLMGLAVDHEADAHGGWKPITCQTVDTPGGPIRVQADQPIPPELATAFGDLAGAVRANHATDPTADLAESARAHGIDPDGPLTQLLDHDVAVVAVRLGPQEVIAGVLSGFEDHTDETVLASADDVIHALHVAGYTITSQETP